MNVHASSVTNNNLFSGSVDKSGKLNGQTDKIQTVITGVITDENGVPLPGVTVLIKETTVGVVSDFDGEYSIDVSGEASILVFSYIGFKTQEVEISGRTEINVELSESAEGLDEIIVTALGIKRSKKSLAYSVTTVEGDELTKARETNIANSLGGKIAGVNVSKTATGPAGTTRVLIRGNSSLTGNNQPLYVIDGIPIDNANRGSAGEWGGNDGGDGIGNINPDDIETMSVLKGNSAAALYGSQASNGVILITTKKGKTNQALQVNINSNFVFEDAINHLDPQREYGHGFDGEKPTTQKRAWEAGEFAWGDKLDGSSVIQFDGESRPYSYSGNNFDKFYRTGSTFTNTIALSGGTKDVGYRFSASNMENESIVPNSGMKRKTFSMNLHGKALNDKLSFQASAQYILQDVRNRPRVADSPGNIHYAVWQLPVTTNIYDLKGDPNRLGANPEDVFGLYGSTRGKKGYELPPASSIYFENPYWAAYQMTDQDSKNRIISSVSLQYDVNDWAYVKGRAGIDQSNRIGSFIRPTGTGHDLLGSMSQSQNKYIQSNFDVMLGSDHKFDNGIGYDFLVGANKMRMQEDGTSATGDDFALPFFYSIANGINNSGGSTYSKLGRHSVYGQAEISYDDWLFLTGSARNDWFSVLDGRDVFYPSLGLSTVLTDVLKLPEVFDYAKVRASWAQVGGVGDVSVYSLNQNYSLGRAQLGIPQGTLSGTAVRNPNLKPLLVTEFDLGFNVQLFNNRLGIDFSYYNKKTEDDILNAGISYASGYNSTVINVGELSNKGVELLLTGTPIKNRDFKWDVSFNMAYNKSEVVSLVDPDDDEERFDIGLSRSRHAWVTHIEGEPFGQITATYYLRDENGEIVLDADGYPKAADGTKSFGTGLHPFTAGFHNSFRYKNWNFSFLIEMKDGAVGHSGTNQQMYRRGLHKNTLVGRENGLGAVSVSNLQRYYETIDDIGEEFIYDAGFVKLREIMLGFNLPSKFLNNTLINKASISAVARNIWTIHSNVDNIDPESNFNAGNAQGLEFFASPQTSSYGININLTF